MKGFVVLAIVLLARDTFANPIIAVAETGASAQFRNEDNLGNYNFGYNEDHTSGGTFRREAGDAHGNVAGSYGLRDADGRVRIVNYIANDDGFKADIKTNEPGVEPKDPADATINKAESIIVETVAAPAPYIAVPAAEPVVLKTEQVAVASPVFPPVSTVPIAKTVSQPVAYAFPEPAAIPVAKTHTTTITAAETKPVAYAFPEPAAVPVAKSIVAPAPLTYSFPPVVDAPVAKTSTTTITTEARPAPYALHGAATVPVAKTHTTTITAAKPVAYAFPEPAAVPVAKSIVAPAALTYSFPPVVDAPVAKTSTTTITTDARPAPYALHAAVGIPVTKSATTTITTEARPAAYAFPPVVPVAKSSATTITTEARPIGYTFPETAAVPIAKSVVAPVDVGPAAALTYAFPAPAAVAKSSSLHYAAAPIATAPLAYAAPSSRFSYATEVRTNSVPARYAVSYAPGALTYGPGLRYTINPHLSAFRYATPFYKSLYSPVVASFAGPVPYFSNIEYHGYPVVKK